MAQQEWTNSNTIGDVLGLGGMVDDNLDELYAAVVTLTADIAGVSAAGLPSMSGHSGKYLTNDGNVTASWTTIDDKQDTLVAATNIKTVNGNSLLGSGNLTIEAGSGSVTSVANGNGMDFTTFATTGTITLGTPGTLTPSSSNAVSTSSHTHDLATGTSSATVALGNHAHSGVYSVTSHTHSYAAVHTYHLTTTVTAVGAYLFGASDYTVSAGGTIPGSSLKPGAIYADTDGGAVSGSCGGSLGSYGTWRLNHATQAVDTTHEHNYNIWQRIA